MMAFPKQSAFGAPMVLLKYMSDRFKKKQQFRRHQLLGALVVCWHPEVILKHMRWGGRRRAP